MLGTLQSTGIVLILKLLGGSINLATNAMYIIQLDDMRSLYLGHQGAGSKELATLMTFSEAEMTAKVYPNARVVAATTLSLNEMVSLMRF